MKLNNIIDVHVCVDLNLILTDFSLTFFIVLQYAQGCFWQSCDLQGDYKEYIK